jgi:hypothetical protein
MLDETYFILITSHSLEAKMNSERKYFLPLEEVLAPISN